MDTRGRTAGEWRALRLNSLRVIVSLIAAGCSDAGNGAPSATVRDSAGIRIVEYAGEPNGTHAIHFSAEPIFRHGLREGDYLFQAAWTGALQPDGGAVIGDARNSEVVVIAPDGSLRGVLARSGEGPAEVSRVTSVTVLGQDTILVEDDGNGKLMVFEGGQLARTVPLAGDFSVTQALRIRGVDSGGRPLMTTSAFRPGFTEEWLQGHMVVLDTHDVVPDTIASFDMVRSSSPNGPESPFPPQGVPVASGGRFVYGRSDTPELAWRGVDGRIEQILRWNPGPSYPTESDWNAFQERMRSTLPRMNPGRSAAELEAMIERSLSRYEVDYGAPLPLYLTMNGDADGGVWLAHFAAGFSPDAIPAYDVISSDGTWIGTVECPPRFRVLDVAGNRVLGVMLNDLDIESVAVFELEVVPL